MGRIVTGDLGQEIFWWDPPPPEPMSNVRVTTVCLSVIRV